MQNFESSSKFELGDGIKKWEAYFQLFDRSVSNIVKLKLGGDRKQIDPIIFGEVWCGVRLAEGDEHIMVPEQGNYSPKCEII